MSAPPRWKPTLSYTTTSATICELRCKLEIGPTVIEKKKKKPTKQRKNQNKQTKNSNYVALDSVTVTVFSSVQFSPLTDWVVRGDTRNDSTEILFQSFLQKALVSGSAVGKDVHSLMLSVQPFLFRPRRRPPSGVPWWMVLERLSWRVPFVRMRSSWS